MAVAAEARSQAPLPVADATGAQRLVEESLAAVAALSAALDDETAQVRAGRLGEGLAGEVRKAELAARYLKGTELLKANAVALARFAPAGIARLREAHGGLAARVAANQAVLATARAVAEGLVKELSDELGKGSRPQTYGAGPSRSPYGAPRGEPLVLSRSL